MLSHLYSWLESRVYAFPPEAPSMPPATTWGFIRFYARPFLPIILAGLMFSVAIAIIEVRVYAFVGRLIDQMG
jgi:ATP-binding cassette subfamily B multidrug efflux pump